MNKGWQRARCVGCHTSTPDGSAVAITDHWPWNSKVTNISGEVGGRPDYLTNTGDLLLQMPWQGTTTFSVADWNSGARRVVSSYEGRAITLPTFNPQGVNGNWQGLIFPHPETQADELAWIDLSADGIDPEDYTDPNNPGQSQQEDQAIPRAMVEAFGTGWGIVERQGDPRSAITPDWSHSGLAVTYTSTDDTVDGHLDQATEADIYRVPFNNGAGGPATPVAGAATPGNFEYYPDYSADDRFIAFNRVAQGNGEGQQIYYHEDGEIYVVPTGGQDPQPIRLAANDPVECTGESSPGVTNSWAKWSPVVRSSAPNEAYSGRKYYFMIFASTRLSPFEVAAGGNGTQANPASQLYMTTMVENEDGSIETYPALYLWNQNFLANGGAIEPLQMSNLTPAWDEFVVPPIAVTIQ